MNRLPQLTIAQFLLWTTAVAGLLLYTQLMPLGTLIPERTWPFLAFTVLYSCVGGIALGALIWLAPGIIRGEATQRDPGELLLAASGVIVVVDIFAMARTAGMYNLHSVEFYREYVWLNCLFAVPLFLSLAAISVSGLAWKCGLAAPAIAYATWGLITHFDQEEAGLQYFWFGQRNIAAYLQLLTPIIALMIFAFVVVRDARRQRRSAAHWLGIILLLIGFGQSLVYLRWYQLWGLLLPPE